MVVHSMGLFAEGFEMIKSGRKQIEIRLNDEKRRSINPGDRIEFWRLPDKNESIEVEVISHEAFSSFEEAYRNLSFEKMGRSDKSMQWMIDASYDFYSRQDEEKYGILAIYFELINDRDKNSKQ